MVCIPKAVCCREVSYSACCLMCGAVRFAFVLCLVCGVVWWSEFWWAVIWSFVVWCGVLRCGVVCVIVLGGA